MVLGPAMQRVLLTGDEFNISMTRGTGVVPIPSGQYLLDKDDVTKYLGFAMFGGDKMIPLSVNPKYLVTAICGGIFFEISPGGNWHNTFSFK